MKKIFALVPVLMAFLSNAQPTVTTGLTLDEYVNTYLLGNGVTAFNITSTGLPEQIGYMEGGLANGLPIDAGLVLATDHASNLACGTDFLGIGINGEPDLLNIANSVPPLIGQNFFVDDINDVCILEFDFVATGDTVMFNYVFGSDEYLTFVNSNYNDIFAFFLSGPGISGPYASPAGFPNGAINIAGVPNANPPLPITISSVNNVLNSEYYIDHTAPGTDIPTCVNGTTVTLRAEHEVICGEVYHIKLAIADGSDGALASYVMLEAGSFESTLAVEVSLSIDVGGDNLFEDCGEGTLTFIRPEDLLIDEEAVVLIEYTGTAENGVDYTALPEEIVFLPGVVELSFPLDAFEDGIPEGIEVVNMEIQNIAACDGVGVTSYFTFTITDEPEPLIVNDLTVNFCDGVPVELIPDIEGGYGVFSYDWSNGADSETLFVTESANTTYSVIVSDTCGMTPDEGIFTLEMYPPINIEFTSDLIVNGALEVPCGSFGTLFAEVTGGSGEYTYYWYDQNGNNLFGFQNQLFVGDWMGQIEIFVDVTDENCDYTYTLSIPMNIDAPALYVELPGTVTLNCGTQFTLEPELTGGVPTFFYSWFVNGVYQTGASSYIFTAMNSMTVTLTISDACGQQVTVNTEVIVETPPLSVTVPSLVTGPCTEVFTVAAESLGGSGAVGFVWTVNGTQVGTGSSVEYSSFDDVYLVATGTDICGTSDSDSTFVNIENPPLVLSLGDNIYASCVDVTTIEPLIEGGVEPFEFQWFVADTAYATTQTIDVQSYSTINVDLIITDACQQTDEDNTILFIPDIPVVVTVEPDTLICFGDFVAVQALAEGGEGGFTYFWTELEEEGAIQTVGPLRDTIFHVVATDICGRTGLGQVNIDVQRLEVSFETTEVETYTYQFTPEVNLPCDNCTFEWEFGDGNSSGEREPLHEYDGLAEYVAELLVTTEIGCTGFYHAPVTVPLVLYVPNAFTPDQDGINDYFRVWGSGIDNFEIRIFDRWGEKVYESRDIEGIWDGSHQGGGYYVPNGVYVWEIEISGVNFDARKQTGTVTILR